MKVSEIQAAKPGDVLRDDQVRGLQLRVFESGSTWYLYYRTARGQQRKPKIGPYPRLSITKARAIAKDMLDKVSAGADPSRDRRAEQKTVAELVKRYLAEHAAHKKSGEEDARMMERHILPALGKLPIAEVDYDDIAALKKKLAGTPYQANRVLALLRKMFNLAETWRLRPQYTNPTRGVTHFRERPRKRYLQPEEFPTLAKALDDLEAEHPFGVALIRLELLTGARSAELLNAPWSAYQPARRRIYLEDSKTGDEREIYLNRQAVEVLENLPRHNEWIFPQDTTDERPMTPPKHVWKKVRELTGFHDLRMHDLRHTFASLRLAGGSNLDMIGQLLGHKSALTTRRYAHLIEDWALQEVDAHGTAVERLSKAE